MESKLLVGGKNIVDHTNEQQRMLEQKRQEIAEQVKKHLKMNPSLNYSPCMKVTNKNVMTSYRIVTDSLLQSCFVL